MRKIVIEGRYRDGAVSTAKAVGMSNKTQVVPVINVKEKLRRIKIGGEGCHKRKKAGRTWVMLALTGACFSYV